MDILKGRLSEAVKISGKLTDAVKITGGLSIPKIIYPSTYQGEYTVTPTDHTQVLQTSEYYLLENITINPIPNNYGLITWDGSTLTVS